MMATVTQCRLEEEMVAATGADRVLARAVEAGEVPGVVALATNERGAFYEGVFGQRAFGQGPAMTLDTVFAIMSMSKPITSVAALQLVEQGRIALDEPLGQRLPELAASQVLDGFDDHGAPRFRAPRRAITLRHLLTHTAGFAYSIWNADLLRYQEFTGTTVAALKMPAVSDPGERWEYGTNTDWVGHLVEQVSGQSLEDYFRAHILDPLGMRDTSFMPGPDQRARLATRYQRPPDGSLQPLVVEIPLRPESFSGGGGLFSTGADYVRFLRMLLNGGQFEGTRILQPETVAEMARNQIGALTVGPLRSTTPARSNDAEFFPGMDKHWGLAGLLTTTAAPTGRSAGSWAWAGLANTYFWLDPARRIAGLLLTQILPFCDRPALDLFDQFERAIYASLG
jgi:methyl acetate hydrolase